MMNLVPNSKCPPHAVEDLSAWGVKLAIYSALSANAALHSIRAAMLRLKTTGKDDAGGEKHSPKDFFEILRLDKEVELDLAAGSTALKIV